MSRNGRGSIRGITLIALVITIIVLLILAGVTISALSGDNGILQNAGMAKEETEIGDEKDQIIIAIAGTIADNRGGNLTEDKFRINLVDRQGNNATVTDDGENLKVKFNDTKREYLINKVTGKLVEPLKPATPGVPADGMQEYNGAKIPDGFTVSTEQTEQDVNNGLVVIAPDESEFVWVPVDGETLCAAGVAGKEMAEYVDGNYRGILYEFSETTSKRMDSTEYREPDLVTDYDNDSRTYLQAIGLTQEQFKKQIQDDYNDMIESIKKYGGFYIGRYETSMNDATAESVSKSGTSEIVASKKGVMPVSAEYNSQMWYGLYDKERSYAEDTGISSAVKSSMIWGSQYDAMLNWVLQGSYKDKVTHSSTKHGPEPTASEPTEVINNIFDLGNNLYEWTLEANSTKYRINRGGNYEDSSSPDGRARYSSNYDGSDNTSRLTLIL